MVVGRRLVVITDIDNELVLLGMKHILKKVLEDFPLDVHGVHGPKHWGRVCNYGMRIAEARGADKEVVKLFAFLHDSKRVNEHKDPNHGNRACQFAESLNGIYFDLTDYQMYQLRYAMAKHSGGLISSDPTIQTCWDADRLDLWRVYKEPNPLFLSKEASALIGYARRINLIDAH